MADVHDKATRSKNMSAIKGKDTQPELLIRKALHASGYRYRLHDKKLPGKPDLVFLKYKAVIQINGCFWHGHDCHLFKWPKTRQDFWKEKIGKNITNDVKNQEKLNILGWRVLVLWECAVKGRTRLPFDDVLIGISKWLLDAEGNLEIRGEDVCDN